MSQIDFSNAVIEPYNGATPLRKAFLGLSNYNSSTTIYGLETPSSGGGYWLASQPSMTVLTSSASKYSVLYTGTISNVPSGDKNQLIIETQQSGGYEMTWSISNISFDNGDTYSFVIDVDITGS